jgi:CBS domain-containing protein
LYLVDQNIRDVKVNKPALGAGKRREEAMRVADILKTKGARVATVRMHETVEVAARILHQQDIGAIVVKDVCGTEGDVVLGIVSERDILRALADQGSGALKKPVSRFVSRKLVSCCPEDSVQHVRDLLERHQVTHLPVLDGHTLVGVLGPRDLLLPTVGAPTPHDGLGMPTTSERSVAPPSA